MVLLLLVVVLMVMLSRSSTALFLLAKPILSYTLARHFASLSVSVSVSVFGWYVLVTGKSALRSERANRNGPQSMHHTLFSFTRQHTYHENALTLHNDQQQQHITSSTNSNTNTNTNTTNNKNKSKHNSNSNNSVCFTVYGSVKSSFSPDRVK